MSEIEIDLFAKLEAIPEKMAFKIGEVADIAGVKPYVLRYWQTEFDMLKPQKSRHNQRMYSRKDVETVLLIKKLLYKDRFSISGARMALRRLRQDVKEQSSQYETVKVQHETVEKAEKLREDLAALKDLF